MEEDERYGNVKDRYGRIVRERRRGLGLTQTQLATAIHRSQGWVALLENLRLNANATARRNIEAYLRRVAATRADLGGGADAGQVAAAARVLRAREVAP